MSGEKMQLDFAIALVREISPANHAAEAPLELVPDNAGVHHGLEGVHEGDVGLEVDREAMLAHVAHVLLVAAAEQAVVSATRTRDPGRVRCDVMPDVSGEAA